MYRRSWCSFWGSLHYFFSISWPSWGSLGGIFGLILGNVYLILHDCSIFSHETLYRCSWYNSDGHYTQKTFYIMPSLCWGSFWGILGRILVHVHIFSRYSFNILSWNFAQVFLVWPWLSLILFFDIISPSTLRLLFENRSIRSVKFCTGVLGVPFEGHCTIFFPYHDPPGEA